MSQQSGSGRSCSDESTESQSGSTTRKPKPDFGKKHRKIVRILTVIAYIISVSTAAVLLSAYYVFLWKPTAPGPPTDAPTTVAMARQMQTQSPSFSSASHGSHALKYNSFALPASQNVGMNSNRFFPTKTRKSAYHHYGKTNYPQIPTPQALMDVKDEDEREGSTPMMSTTPQVSASPPSPITSDSSTRKLIPQIEPTNKTNAPLTNPPVFNATAKARQPAFNSTKTFPPAVGSL